MKRKRERGKEEKEKEKVYNYKRWYKKERDVIIRSDIEEGNKEYMWYVYK